ncbi:MAG: Aminoglycoside phosphotransferase [uncultured bacterium]|nr:MAG: Aminoglycoside phosphotransferase [uncultured bacterium]HCM68269.1 hypothetical protein [Candidatus Kerfeldbacteria bacterium]
MTTSRNKVVLWIGSEPDPSLKHEFTVRDHEFKHLQYDEFDPADPEIIKNICQAKGVLFLHDKEKPSRTFDFIGCISKLPVSYSGVLPYVFVNDPNSIPAILGNLGVIAISTRQTIPFFDTSASSDYSTFAQTLTSHDSGRSPKLGLNIHDDTTSLEEADRILLQRSFSDCSSIIIRGTPQGFSAKVITVFAEFEVQGPVRHSVPFIAKLDKKDDVEKEINNYKDYIDHFVPFYLRPGVDRSRCFFDQERGIIVANYVDHSTSLLDAITRGAGPAALHTLFDETLRRWFHNAVVREDSLYLTLQKGNPNTDRFVMNEFERNPNILIQAKKFDTVLNPAELLEAVKAIPCVRYLFGISHKDLHAKNVLVRGSDAVIIDFPRCEHGPILLDLATLDVSIAFDSTPILIKENIYEKEIYKKLEEEYEKKFKEWLSFVSDIFSIGKILGLPMYKNGHEPLAREWSCIRQIRRLALLDQEDKHEYAICVAIELLRRSMFGDENPRVAGCAYYLADRLIKSLSINADKRLIQNET